MSIISKDQDSFIWCANKPENPLPPVPKDWASLYPKYHTWLEDAIRMQLEKGVIKERTKNGEKVYSMTALAKIIGQYDTQSAVSSMEDIAAKAENQETIRLVKEMSTMYKKQSFVPPFKFLDLVIGMLRPNQEGYLPSLYRKHIQDNGRLVAIGSSLAVEITMQNHQEIEHNPALQAARNETEMAIQADLPEEMRGRMTLTSAQAAASPAIRDEAQAQHERKLEVMDKTHEQKIQFLQEQSESKLQLAREQGDVKIRIRDLELKNNLDTIRLRHELKITNSSNGSAVIRTRKSVRQAKQILVQPDTDIKNPKDLEQAVAIILDNYFHPSTKTKDCIPVENIKEIVRAVLDKNLLDFSWSEEEKNVYVAQLDSLGWNFVVDLFLSAKQQYKKAVVTRAPNASVLCKL